MLSAPPPPPTTTTKKEHRLNFLLQLIVRSCLLAHVISLRYDTAHTGEIELPEFTKVIKDLCDMHITEFDIELVYNYFSKPGLVTTNYIELTQALKTGQVCAATGAALLIPINRALFPTSSGSIGGQGLSMVLRRAKRRWLLRWCRSSVLERTSPGAANFGNRAGNKAVQEMTRHFMMSLGAIR